MDDFSPEKVGIAPRKAKLEVDSVVKASSSSSLPSWTVQGYKVSEHIRSYTGAEN